jgi:hypothetical protein
MLSLLECSVADPGCLSRIQDQRDSETGSASKNLKIFLTPTIVSKLSEMGSGMFIPDPDLDFLLIPDPGI